MKRLSHLAMASFERKHMKKKIIGLAALLSAAFLLASGCTPLRSIIPDQTTKPSFAPIVPDDIVAPEITDYVVKSKNYYFGKGEYFYYYFYLFDQFTDALSDEQLRTIGLEIPTDKTQLNFSLKDRKTPEGTSWFDYFRDITLDYMTEILMICEMAVIEDGYCVNEAQKYFNEQIKAPLSAEAKKNAAIGSFENLIYAMYYGEVSAKDYGNAIQKQYIYDNYYDTMQERLYAGVTDEQAEGFAASNKFVGEKSTKASRSIAYIEMEIGSAETNKALADSLLEEFNVLEPDLNSLKSIAARESLSVDVVDDLTEAKMKESELAKWLFASERKPNDSTVIKSEVGSGYVLVFYYKDGRPIYILDAKDQLTEELMESSLENMKELFEPSVDLEKANSLNEEALLIIA